MHGKKDDSINTPKKMRVCAKAKNEQKPKVWYKREHLQDENQMKKKPFTLYEVTNNVNNNIGIVSSVYIRERELIRTHTHTRARHHHHHHQSVTQASKLFSILIVLFCLLVRYLLYFPEINAPFKT